MNHHESPGANNFDCVDSTTGAHCLGGWPRPLPLGLTVGNVAKPSGSVSNNSEYVVDNGKLYYAAHDMVNWGIGCFDLELETHCGLTQFVGASPTNTKIVLSK